MGSVGCSRCGCERFTEPQFSEAPEGGMTVVLMCSACGHPNPIFTEQDPEFIRELAVFFQGPPGAGDA